MQEGEELVRHEEDGSEKSELKTVTPGTRREYVIFFSSHIDGRLDFVFASDHFLSMALQRAAAASADGGRVHVYERVHTYEVTNGKQYGL